MSNIKRNIIFALENRKKEGVLITENVPIRMRVIYANNRIDFSTGFRIDASKWDNEKERIKNGCTNKLKQSSSDINTRLSEYYTYLQNIFKTFETRNTIPTPKELKEEFKNAITSDDSNGFNSNKINFMDSIDEFTKETGRQNNWTDATFQKFTTMKRHLNSFKTNLNFEYFDEKGLNDYIIFLRDEKDMRNSTIEKQVGFLKWFLRWADKKGYNKNKAYDFFKPKLKNAPKTVIFLTWEELTKLTNCKIPDKKQYLERVRDVFLFSCYTGLRHSDIYNLKRNNVKKDHLDFTTKKTGERLIVELNKHSESILKKYKNINFEDNKALPVISNQNMNDYLKELAELAEINESINQIHYKGNKRIEVNSPKYSLIGTHAGRRTFVCNALALGIPAQVVMKWTGHSDYASMKPYIGIADSIKADAMTKFNQL
ncbi:site-specific integrase [Flavobacterium undicola]|uniref:site-specific integrase n=1 Tax=Flavobacterium undicola TaxID=1932779 RepID=UPI001376EA05|nr:site-specific integrase [Flavobacterium undicola]MBA0882738.1 site-specific integrase [Flavobacterium undicola]